MEWKRFMVAAGIASFSLATIAIAQEGQLPAGEPEWAPVVKRLSSEEVPIGMRFTSKVIGLVGRAGSDASLAKIYFEAHGLDLTDADLDRLVALYGDFDERHSARHTGVLEEHAGDMETIRASGDRYKMERASFTGRVLGTWLATLRSEGQETDRFIASIATEGSTSYFWGGRAPTLEDLEAQGSAFEVSFRRAYGVPLSALVGSAPDGGER